SSLRRTPLISFSHTPDHRDLHSFPTRRSSDLNQALRHQSPFIREISLHPQPSCPWFASAARASGRSTENTEDHGGPWQSRAGELGRRTAAAPGPDAFSSPSSRSPSAPLRDPSEPPNTVSWRALTEEEGQ